MSPAEITYENPTDFTVMTYSGEGDVTKELVPVDTDLTPNADSTSGCEADDFNGFPPGTIALMQRGTCSFAARASRSVWT